MSIRVRILKNRGARITRDTRLGPVTRFEPPDGSLRVDEAAAFLGVTLNRLYRRISAGTLKCHRPNSSTKAWTIPLSEVKQLRGASAGLLRSPNEAA
jgi:excisionase family DNA binding protein